MTSRNLKQELQYYVYNDPEYGEDIINLDYPSLINLLGELLDRVENLEAQVSKKEEAFKDVNEIFDSVFGVETRNEN